MGWHPGDLLVQILDDACPSSLLADGYNEYMITTHCWQWSIIAKKTPMGTWTIKSYQKAEV